jgi:undecaprenyl-diphosphatase
MAFLSDLNLAIFHFINGFCGSNETLDRLVGALDVFGLKGIALMGTFGVLWFQPSPDQARRREILIVTLVAMSAAILASRAISSLAPFEMRPMATSGIGYRAPLYRFDYTIEDWSCFPSNQAAMMFSLATGCWFASRMWGALFGAFSLAAMLARVYVGGHYPGDVAVGALIGIAVAVPLLAAPVRRAVAAPFLAIERKAPAFFYSALLASLFEAGIMFGTIRTIGKIALHLMTVARN